MIRKLEEDYNRLSLLVNVARLYYEYDYNQGAIAKKLGFSRPYISKLIAQAREEGIVTISINDPVHAETALERTLRQRFALRKVIVVPQSVEQSTLSRVGVTCARYLDSIVSDSDIIGIAWGATMFACARHAIMRRNISDITVVQLCGGISNIERDIYADEIPKLFADALSGTAYHLPLPAIMDSAHVKQTVLAERTIKHVMEYAKRANIAIFSLGEIGANNAHVHAGYLNDQQLSRLEAVGAVGDICSHFIDESGSICDENLDERTIGLPLEDLKKKDYRIAVAVGQRKVRCICGALNGGYPNVLITDEETAEAILKRLNATGVF